MNPLDLRFPLVDDALPKLLVDAETISAWTRAAKTEVAGVIQNRDSWYFRGDELTGAFKLVFEQESLRGFTRNSHMPDKHEYLCHGNLQLTLDDVAFALHSATTFEFRSGQVQLFPDTFLDAAVLHVAERPSAGEPCRFAGVKWAAHSSPSSTLVAPRDYIYFEYLCKTRDADGRPVVVQYIECPELFDHQVEEHDMGLTRASMFTIRTFRTDLALGGTYYQSAGSLHMGKGMPSWAAAKTLVHNFRSMLQLSGLADARAISALNVLKTLPKRSTRSSANKLCYVCEKKFHVLTRARIACRACGHCACRSCIVALQFFNETSLYSSTLPVLAERFCLKCVMNAREQRREGGALSRSSTTTSIVCGSVSIASDSTSSSCCSDEPQVTSVGSELLTRNTIDAVAGAGSAKHSVMPSPPPSVSRSVSEGTQRSDVQRMAPFATLSPVSLADTLCAAQPPSGPAPPTKMQSPPPPHASSSPPVSGLNAFQAASRAPSSSQGSVSSSARSSATSVTDAFAKMSESIAAQSMLLMQLQNSMSLSSSASAMGSSVERYNFASPPISPCNGSVQSDSDDRFEILI